MEVWEYRREIDRAATTLSRELARGNDDVVAGLRDIAELTQLAGDRQADALAELNRDLGRAAAVQAQLLSDISQQMSHVAQGVADLARLTANPLDTAGAERRRRAATALQHGWLAEAEVDAQAATAANPYDYPAHLLLAQTYARWGDHARAGESYARAARYAAPYDQATTELAAGTAANHLDHVGRTSDAISTLNAAVEMYPSSADLHFALGRRGRESSLTAALVLDPNLVVGALAADLNVSQAAAAARDVHRRYAARIRAAAAGLRAIDKQPSLVLPEHPRSRPPVATPEADLLVASAQLGSWQTWAEQVVTTLRSWSDEILARPEPTDPGPQPKVSKPALLPMSIVAGVSVAIAVGLWLAADNGGKAVIALFFSLVAAACLLIVVPAAFERMNHHADQETAFRRWQADSRETARRAEELKQLRQLAKQLATKADEIDAARSTEWDPDLADVD